MSLDENDQQLEMRSAHGSSCDSAHEMQSNSDDADLCSQSDISLCDDGGSEEGEHEQYFNTHSRKSCEEEDEEDDGLKAFESYEDDDEHSSLQQTKNGVN